MNVGRKEAKKIYIYIYIKERGEGGKSEAMVAKKDKTSVWQ